MAQKIYVIEGRQFRTAAEYNRAMHDKKIIDRLKPRMEELTAQQLKQLKKELENGNKIGFQSILGQDFLDEMDEQIEKKQRNPEAKKNNPKIKKTTKDKKGKQVTKKTTGMEQEDTALSAGMEISDFVQEELLRQEKKRRRMILICGLMAVICLGYVSLYTYYDYKTANNYQELSELKEKPVSEAVEQLLDNSPLFTLDKEKEAPEVLEEYKNLLFKNKKLIGWVKIADTNIDYPVMQTSDNEYYLDHNLNQEYDKNGSIFMDKDCDVLKPSTNFILYGHHMKNGSMFGKLHLYSEESYYEKHPYIEFDTIYEKGTYQVMYVFRSRVYSEEEIVFKYYQFIDAYSEQEFESYMREMAAMSYYNTGVTAKYGDQLLTLSTCDYQEKDGRFVVVAKKID